MRLADLAFDGTAFLVAKEPGRDADRWLFIPALNLVQRIAARDVESSFVGSDFS
ncbi:MAG: outer membrane lipoprotein-sorting protein, partial [Micrococcales bacterium]|nr:outer membrane lipoprotein-sorting protein [Micrococcales bacterium]